MRALLTALVVLLPMLTAAQDNHLNHKSFKSFKCLVDSILANNPALRIAANEGRMQVAETKAANALEAAEIEYSPFFTRGMSGLASSELIVSQSFRLPWAYGSTSRLAKAQARAGELQLRAMREDLRIAATNLCIEVMGLEQSLAYSRQRLAFADSIIAFYQKGDATALQIKELQIERAAVANECLSTEAVKEKALLLLAEMNGGKSIDIGDIGDIFDNSEIADIFDNSDNFDTRLAAANARVDVARQGLQAARAASLPALTLGYRRNTEGELSSHGVLIGARIPIFTGRREREIARLQLANAREEASVRALEVERERATLQIELQLAIQQLANVDTALIHSTLSLLHSSLQHRQITLADYLSRSSALYEKLQQAVAMRTLLRQTMTALSRE